MLDAVSLSRDIVLIGGGHAHALLLRAWGMKPLPGARLTLINPAATAPYTGMLPGFVAGHYDRDDLEIDLVRLARFAGARMIFGRVTAIDRKERLIEVPGRAPIFYDYASIDIGITSDMPDLRGFLTHGVAAKPLGPFADRWRAHLDGGGGSVVVIGGGVAGIELALAMEYALPAGTKVTLVEAESVLPGVNAGTVERLRTAWQTARIEVIEHTTVTEVRAGTVVLSDGRTIPAALTVGAAGARPFGWLNETGLDLHRGYIAVGPDLRSTNDPNIFAVGDCAHLAETPRPKAGVFAVRAAPVLTDNLKAIAAGRPLKPFRPQSEYLKLISLGRKAAVADKGKWSFGGAWAWRWKDWIDQRFMAGLANLPQMTPPALPALRALGDSKAQPLCAACGAKIAPAVLDRVLVGAPPLSRPDVLSGPGDDAAILEIGSTKQVLTTDHLRAFWADPWLFGRIAALHALGDVWAMGARPQAALAQITLPRMDEPLQERWLGEIMAAAREVLDAENATIVGGHTAQGSDFTVGFTITGLDPAPALTAPRPEQGDALILTRPLGAGTLFAAEMAGTARGDDVEHMLSILARSQGDVARLLVGAAHAMTDVTGFGLAGHAARMVSSSGLSVNLDLAAIPLYPGAETLAAKGIRSTLWSGNRAAVTYDGPETPVSVLLFDPQTAGGLLAAVPDDKAESLAKAVRELGHEAAVIGHLGAGGGAAVTAR